MLVSTHPFWLVGFRPFFTLACLAGIVLPVAWGLVFSGAIEAPAGSFTSVQWQKKYFDNKNDASRDSFFFFTPP